MHDLSRIKTIVIVPAYGRRYKSRDDVRYDWDEHLDFTIKSITPTIKTGRYINKADVLRYSPQAEVVYQYGSFGIILRENKYDR